jgi:hypothetical protein
MIFE